MRHTTHYYCLQFAFNRHSFQQSPRVMSLLFLVNQQCQSFTRSNSSLKALTRGLALNCHEADYHVIEFMLQRLSKSHSIHVLRRKRKLSHRRRPRQGQQRASVTRPTCISSCSRHSRLNVYKICASVVLATELR